MLTLVCSNRFEVIDGKHCESFLKVLEIFGTTGAGYIFTVCNMTNRYFISNEFANRYSQRIERYANTLIFKKVVQLSLKQSLLISLVPYLTLSPNPSAIFPKYLLLEPVARNQQMCVTQFNLNFQTTNRDNLFSSGTLYNNVPWVLRL